MYCREELLSFGANTRASAVEWFWRFPLVFGPWKEGKGWDGRKGYEIPKSSPMR